MLKHTQNCIYSLAFCIGKKIPNASNNPQKTWDSLSRKKHNIFCPTVGFDEPVGHAPLDAVVDGVGGVQRDAVLKAGDGQALLRNRDLL